MHIAMIAIGSRDLFPARKWYAWFTGSAPKTGNTIAFIKNLNTIPKTRPDMMVTTHFRGLL
jgi:hypothetical protein